MKKMLLAGLLLSSGAFAAHPLLTDDTGVQGQGKWQFETSVDRDTERDTELVSLGVAAKLTYGLTETIDISIEQPWARVEISKTPKSHVSGVNDTELALKWRAVDAGKFSASVNPYLTLPVGDGDKGMGNEKATYGLNLAAAWSEEWADCLFNVGYTRNDNDAGDRKNIWNSSFAVVGNVAEAYKLVAEVGTYSNGSASDSQRPVYSTLGVIYSPKETLDLDVGFRKGLNKAEVKHSIGMGVAVRW